MTKFFSILLLTTSISLFSYSQKMTPSERRKQKEQESSEESNAKDKKQMYNKSNFDFLDTDDPDFKISTIPDKWKNQSAVVICQKMSYSYLRGNQNVNIDEIVHKRIKLMDKAAVSDFSEFYFVGLSDILIKIIKPDGKEFDVDIKEAKDIKEQKETTEDVPRFYKVYYLYDQITYKKLAIPNLQEGDIIDYCYKTTRMIAVNNLLEVAFDPFVFTLASTYPIMKQEFKYTVDRGFYINFSSYNGAPSLKEGDSGYDVKGRKRAMIKTYELVDTDREKLSEEIFNYVYRTCPTIKFQILYESPAHVSISNNFIGEKGVAKSSVTPEDIQRVISNRIGDEIGTTFAGDILKYLSKNFPKEKDVQRLSREIYYYYRYLLYDFYYNSPVINLSESQKKDFFYVNEDKFITVLLEVFKKKKIEAKTIVAMPRNMGSMEQLMLTSELLYGVVVKSNDGYIYLFPFSNHSTIDLMDYTLEGADAYVVSPSRNARSSNYEKVTIPSSLHTDNIFKSSLSASFDSNMENLKIKRTSSLSGKFKQPYYHDVLCDYDYLEEDKKKYNPKYKGAQYVRGNLGRIAEENRKKESKKEEKVKQREEAFKKEAEKNFDLVTYTNFQMLEPGRYDESPNLVYSENFEVKNLLNRAGNNYIFDIGKLIEKQMQLKEKDMKRESDIYIPYAKSLVDEITIDIPPGYTVEGLNELIFNIDNASGSFISTAKCENNKIFVKTQKSYKKNFDKKGNWNNMVEVLEAAYKFSQKRILLKKG